MTNSRKSIQETTSTSNDAMPSVANLSRFHQLPQVNVSLSEPCRSSRSEESGVVKVENRDNHGEESEVVHEIDVVKKTTSTNVDKVSADSEEHWDSEMEFNDSKELKDASLEHEFTMDGNKRRQIPRLCTTMVSSEEKILTEAYVIKAAEEATLFQTISSIFSGEHQPSEHRLRRGPSTQKQEKFVKTWTFKFKARSQHIWLRTKHLVTNKRKKWLTCDREVSTWRYELEAIVCDKMEVEEAELQISFDIIKDTYKESQVGLQDIETKIEEIQKEMKLPVLEDLVSQIVRVLRGQFDAYKGCYSLSHKLVESAEVTIVSTYYTAMWSCYNWQTILMFFRGWKTILIQVQNRVGAILGYLDSCEYTVIWRLHQGLRRFVKQDHSSMRHRCRRYTALKCARVIHVFLSHMPNPDVIRTVMSMFQLQVATGLDDQLIHDIYTFLLQTIGSLPLVLDMSGVLWQWFCLELQSFRSLSGRSLLIFLSSSLRSRSLSRPGVYKRRLTVSSMVIVQIELFSTLRGYDLLKNSIRKQKKQREPLTHWLLQILDHQFVKERGSLLIHIKSHLLQVLIQQMQNWKKCYKSRMFKYKSQCDAAIWF